MMTLSLLGAGSVSFCRFNPLQRVYHPLMIGIATVLLAHLSNGTHLSIMALVIREILLLGNYQIPCSSVSFSASQGVIDQFSRSLAMSYWHEDHSVVILLIEVMIMFSRRIHTCCSESLVVFDPKKNPKENLERESCYNDDGINEILFKTLTLKMLLTLFFRLNSE